MSSTIRIATRKSPLALWQAEHIRGLLLTKYPELTVELIPMVTSGDKFLKDKLLAVGGKGLFVKELEEALLDHRADIAVHSTKDVPAELPKGLSLAAICHRDNPLDALISNNYASLDTLPKGAVIGTASLRRQSQLLAYRPDLHFKNLRGNINTRLAKLDQGEYDAIILAAAGLERMGLQESITEHLAAEIMLPSCGQGALSIECRIDDQNILNLITVLNDPISAVCVLAERRVNALLGGNCHIPLAVFCHLQDTNALYLRAKILSSDGSQCMQASAKGTIDQASVLADQCSQSLLNQGASRLIEQVKS